MRRDHDSEEAPKDSPEAIRYAVQMASMWLLVMLLMPTGGLLWQWRVVQGLGHWLMGHVLAQLDLTGLFT